MSNNEPASDSFGELRNLLLSREHERLEQIEAKLRELNLQEEQLQSLLAELRQQHEDTSALIERVSPSMSGMVRRAVLESKDEMAEILGPIMGEAIRVRIRDAREEMVDTLYPIIGETIQKALLQFTREFQRNIDARLKTTFGPEGMARRFAARLRGVSGSELVLRESLAYHAKQAFLIHRTSGMLMAHSGGSDLQEGNSDLISAMLTAIRSFAADAFQANDELDEIQFGEDSIILQSGAHAYLAVVITGVEPAGLRAHLGEFVSNLHLRFNSLLRDFKGETTPLAFLHTTLMNLLKELNNEGQPRVTPKQKRTYILLGAATTLSLIIICFYITLTVRLYPVAFPNQPTAMFTPTERIYPTVIPTLTTSPTSMPTPLPTLTPITAISGISLGSVWVRTGPSIMFPAESYLYAHTEVQIHHAQGQWLYISWVTDTQPHTGWVNGDWIRTTEPIPLHLITPNSP